MRWGGDAEGGAPFVEADPADPARVRGFDVEIAGEIARGLGRRAEFVQVAWSSIDQSAERGDFDIGLSGVEDGPARRAEHSTTFTRTRTSPRDASTPSCSIMSSPSGRSGGAAAS